MAAASGFNPKSYAPNPKLAAGAMGRRMMSGGSFGRVERSTRLSDERSGAGSVVVPLEEVHQPLKSLFGGPCFVLVLA